MSGKDPKDDGNLRTRESGSNDDSQEIEMNERIDTRIGDAARSVRRVRAADVLGPRGIVQIEHDGEIYTLRLTRNNRLILTK